MVGPLDKHYLKERKRYSIISPRVTELTPPTSLIVNVYSVTSGLILILKMYDLVILFII
jgi:hypothetical protein